jgi:hypothetical protein
VLPPLSSAGSLGLNTPDGETAARSDALAIEDELAEAIEARKRAAAAAPAAPAQRRAIAALRRTLQFLARSGALVTFDNVVAGAGAVLEAPAGADADELLSGAVGVAGGVDGGGAASVAAMGGAGGGGGR